MLSLLTMRWYKMILRLLKRQIAAGRWLIFIHIYLLICYAAMKPFPVNRLLNLIVRARVYFEIQRGSHLNAEEILLSYSQRANPPIDVMRLYISHSVNRGYARKAQLILDYGRLSSGNHALLQSAILRVVGRLEEALAALKNSTIEPEMKKHVVRARRSIFHQQRDNLSIATDGLAFFGSEPDYIDFKYLITIAAAAENVEREDLFRSALARIVRDINRVEADEKLAVRHMRDLVTAKLSVFDLDGAIRLLERRLFANNLRARELLSDLRAIRLEVSSFAEDLEKAHRHILMRASGNSSLPRKVSVVLSAAAFRSNVIDYPGFRSDIRFVFGEIISHLRRRGVSYEVGSRIKTHGKISLEQPYFSYHTISDNNFGCHFKETDRPSLFSFDTAGYAGWSNFSELSATEIITACNVPAQVVSEFFDVEKQRVIGGNISKYGQPPATKVERLPEKYIFVALQILADAVSQNAFVTPFEMIDEVIETARKTGICVVIKRHPMCNAPEVTAHLSKLKFDRNVVLSTSSIHPLIRGSQAVCVVNSGVGSEALLHEKPVYVFGKSDYMAACFICRKAGDFATAFVPNKSRLSAVELRQFWWMYRKQYAIDLQDRLASSMDIREAVDRHLARFDILQG